MVAHAIGKKPDHSNTGLLASIVCVDSWRRTFSKSARSSLPPLHRLLKLPAKTTKVAYRKCHPVCGPEAAYSKTRCAYLLNRGYTPNGISHEILSGDVLWGDAPVVCR